MSRIILVALIVSAFAACASPAVSLTGKSYSDGKPLEFEANSVFYDKQNQIAHMKGNVYLFQENQAMVADQVTYSIAEDKLYAKGNVALRREDGSVFFSEEVVFEKASSKGFALDFKGRVGSKSLISANSAEMKNGEHIALNNFIYTPCKICKDNLVSNIPLWQVRANSGELDKAQDKLYFKGAKIDFFGVPVFYTPYFAAPAPGAKRKSGFLMPKYKYNSVFGHSLIVPYYLNIAPNYDATYSPMFLFKKQVIHQGEFRQLLQNGEYTIKGSFLYKDNIDAKGRIIKDLNSEELRQLKKAYNTNEHKAHYNLQGYYVVRNEGFFGGYVDFQSSRLRDKTRSYLKKYAITKEDFLTTDFKYMNYNNYDYHYSVRMLQFQDLRDGYSSKTTPLALPILDGYYQKDLHSLNAVAYAEVNTLNLSRSQGTSYKRFSLKPGIYMPYFSQHGSILKINSFIRTDFYNVDKKAVRVKLPSRTFDSGKQGNEARIFPEISGEWSLPVYSYSNGYAVVLEPVATAAYSAYVTNMGKVSNEDSLDPEINPGNLLSLSKYSGYDKVESGPRANLGLRSSISSDFFDNITLFLGQAFRKHPDFNFTKKTGLHGRSSDYVAKISVNPVKEFMLYNNTRIDKTDYSIQRNEFTLNFNQPQYNMYAIHSYTSMRLLSPGKKFKQEYILGAEYNIYDAWWVSGALHGRIGRRSPEEKLSLVNDGVTLKYLGDCLNMRIGVARDYTNMVNLRPSTTFTYSLSIPTF